MACLRSATSSIFGIALLALAGEASAQESAALREKAREKLPVAGPFVERQARVGDRLIWEDHALLGVCQDLGGTFRKLNGRREYACRLPLQGFVDAYPVRRAPSGRPPPR